MQRSRLHYPRVDAAQVKLLALRRVHEPDRVLAEARRELRTSVVRFGRDFDDGGAELKS